MQHSALLTLVILGVTACSQPFGFGRDPEPAQPAISVTEMPGEDVLRPRARASDGSEDEAPPPPAADGFLGETLAGLGAPGDTGLWLRTGLVTELQQGHIVSADGRRQSVELRPSDAAPGAGSQISLMAMQALGLNLGQLATLRVFID